MRLLSATGIIKSETENVYQHTRFSLAYLDGTEVHFYKLMYAPVIS
jgi:hypothetical protein